MKKPDRVVTALVLTAALMLSLGAFGAAAEGATFEMPDGEGSVVVYDAEGVQPYNVTFDQRNATAAAYLDAVTYDPSDYSYTLATNYVPKKIRTAYSKPASVNIPTEAGRLIITDASGHVSWRTVEEGVQTVLDIADNMIWLLSCLESAKKAGIEMPAKEALPKTNFIRKE